MSSGLERIQHIVVLMLENRSFDHLCGFLYSERQPPRHFLPKERTEPFNGMPLSFSNPSNPRYFSGQGPPEPVRVRAGTENSCAPEDNPQERFEHVNLQLFGSSHPAEGQSPTMDGFLLSYAQAGAKRPEEIMQCYTPQQLAVMSALARNFAICDEWYASVPSQTWPNRAFFHLGTSMAQVEDYPYSPLDYDVPTIFNVLQDIKQSWAIYNDSLLESVTRLQFPQLWDLWLEPHFQQLDAFVEDARRGTLPSYSFLEPSFLVDPNDAHPPHDMLAAEQLVWRVWQAVSGGAHWMSTLLLIMFDEHGGTIDHQPPPYGAEPPDDHRGQNGFAFNRFGVRVPVIAVSPWIEPATVFRSPSQTPYDHTSVIATLRDWLHVPHSAMMNSRRVEKAPTIEHLLNRAQPRKDLPAIPFPAGNPHHTPLSSRPNDFQRGMMMAVVHRLGLRGGLKLLEHAHERQHISDFFATYKQRHQRGA